MNGLVGLAKRLLPPGVRRAMRAPGLYAHRLQIWHHIGREIAGADDAGIRALARARAAAPLTALRGLGEWRDPVLLDDAEVRVAGVGRFSLRAHSDELYIVLPSREPAVFAAIERLVGPGDTFVDAGANIGVFSVAAGARTGPTGQVIAIEMTPATAGRLAHHLALNGIDQARIVRAALSDRSGDTASASIVWGRAGQATLMLAETLTDPRTFTVETTTLGEVLAGVERVVLLKLDVEGAELAALRGAGGALDRIDAIIFEQLDPSAGIDRFLREHGFRITPLDHHNLLAKR